MRCVCCDRELTDAEATAKFVESGAYTEMCRTCIGFLPKGIKVHTRSDLERKEKEQEDADFYDPFDLGDMDDEAW